MKLKSPRAVAGLALALLLALIGGATAAGGGGDKDDQAEEGRVIAASVSESTTPVIADLGDPDAFVFDAETTITTTSTTTTAAPEPTPEPEPAPAPAPAPEPAPVAAVEPAPEPAPTYAPGSIEAIIESYFGPNTPKALSVARCESGLNPNAMSPGGGNHGLFQINNVHSGNFQSVTGVAWSGRYDAHANTAFAKWLFDQSGWGPWACA